MSLTLSTADLACSTDSGTSARIIKACVLKETCFCNPLVNRPSFSSQKLPRAASCICRLRSLAELLLVWIYGSSMLSSSANRIKVNRPHMYIACIAACRSRSSSLRSKHCLQSVHLACDTARRHPYQSMKIQREPSSTKRKSSLMNRATSSNCLKAIA